MRIVVQNKFYKITQEGTFYTDRNRAAEIDDVIANFDADLLSAVGDDLYLVKDGIYLHDTFGTISGNKSIYNILLDENEISENTNTRSLTLGDETRNSSVYGLKTYKWTFEWSINGYFEALKTFFGLLGKDINREHNFDKKHRVQCNLFQTNYVYYATTGIKVKMQKRKKFLFVNYWVGTKAEDIVIGIEELEGKSTFKYNMNVITDWGHYMHNYMGEINNMIYSGVGKPTFVEDWLKSNVIDTYLPGIKSFEVFGKFRIDPWSWTKGLTKDAIFSGLRSLEGKYIEKPARRIIKNGDPKMALYFNGNGSITSHIMGIQSYGAGESKTVRFSQAGGFSLSIGGAPISYLPEKFTMKSIHIFGAVKYNNVWKGVRFYKN